MNKSIGGNKRIGVFFSFLNKRPVCLFGTLEYLDAIKLISAIHLFSRYIASWASLPSITDLLSTLGIARSLSDDPKVLQILEKIIDTVEENMPDLIKDNEKNERSAQDNFTNFLQSFDQSLINIRDAIR